MAKRRLNHTSVIEPDMTPMIDIVFQLLTFFMVVINFENTKADERVKLPKDLLAKPPEVKPAEELVLNVGFDRDLSGRKLSEEPIVFYAGDKFTINNFGPLLEQEKRLAEAKGGKGAIDETTVILRADSEVPTGKVQELIRKCQEIGYTKFSLKAISEEK
ncbi:Biopolymer transport protein ExbD/TolR [Planctopirus limnophila DSM 3776]|uniref:Biopolymer transport protein ExbD/TolR n=2 Tax=Planctopirus TaxID=1649480 RepID=D5SWM5_PLAL2|nr:MULTISPECIES: biopolymer transporter ExbD [Planctopirus]ADG69618.1 Biopolymer transport protein ExbD/TolR [Planctopirus limnophila DSM 3776]